MSTCLTGRNAFYFVCNQAKMAQPILLRPNTQSVCKWRSPGASVSMKRNTVPSTPSGVPIPKAPSSETTSKQALRRHREKERKIHKSAGLHTTPPRRGGSSQFELSRIRVYIPHGDFYFGLLIDKRHFDTLLQSAAIQRTHCFLGIIGINHNLLPRGIVAH